MYFSLYPSSEYYSDEDNDNKIVCVDEKDILEKEICIICWLPSYKTNKIQILSEFKQIHTICKCQPRIHSVCLENWTARSLSCPICRKKITINNFQSNNNNNILMCCYIFCLDKTLYCLRILSYASFLNLICILIYNLYYNYIITTDYIEKYI
jgi:hypothetical protein